MKEKVTKDWIDSLVEIPDEIPSHRLTMTMLRNSQMSRLTVGDVQEMDQIGECWYKLGRAWDNLCDAQKYEYSPYYILNAWEDVRDVIKALKLLGHKENFFSFNITKDGFDDMVADKVKALCYVVLGYVYEWEES